VVGKRDPLTVRQFAVKILPSITLIPSQVEVKLLVNTRCASKRITGKCFRDIVNGRWIMNC
jgi:hypothetical protein